MPSRPIRLLVVQPTLAQYRLAVFREMARRDGIRFRLVYASTPHLKNVTPEGFEAAFEPMRIVRVGSHPAYWQPAQFRLASPRHADVLMLNWDAHYLSLYPALARARVEGVGTVLWGHGYSRHRARWRVGPRQTLGRLADAVALYNQAGADRLIDAGFDPARVFVAPNSIDQAPIEASTQHWRTRPEQLQAFRDAQALGPGPVLLFVARLSPERRVDLLLQAAARLLPERPSLRVAIVGGGEQAADLRRLAESLGIASAVRFAGPVYDEQALGAWFLSSDVFAFPSHMGLSLLHAFGYGLPVVTTDRAWENGPEIEALRPGENGLTYRHGDVADLAAALRRLIDDEPLRRRLGAEALRTVRERYSIPRMVDGLVAAATRAFEARHAP